MVNIKAASTKSEARRLIDQGAVEFDQCYKVDCYKLLIPIQKHVDKLFIRVGKRFYTYVNFDASYLS